MLLQRWENELSRARNDLVLVSFDSSPITKLKHLMTECIKLNGDAKEAAGLCIMTMKQLADKVQGVEATDIASALIQASLILSGTVNAAMEKHTLPPIAFTDKIGEAQKAYNLAHQWRLETHAFSSVSKLYRHLFL